MAKPAAESFPALAALAHGVTSLVQREAALALSEIDKWRKEDEAEELAWKIEMEDD